MLALLLATLLAVPAQDAPAPSAPVAAAPDAAALLKEYEALADEYTTAENAFWSSLPQDATGAITASEEEMAKRPELTWGPRFLELGRRAGATEAGCKALAMAMRMTEKPEAVDEILELLTGTFIDSPSLAGVLQQIGWMRYQRGTAFVAATLRGVREHTKNPEVKAAATFRLAEVLMEPPLEMTQMGEHRMPMSRGTADLAQARTLLTEVRDQFKDSSYAKQAAGCLFELDHLQVGMVAPDVEAKDQDGASFKLSDYRGKVVLLDFWGFW